MVAYLVGGIVGLVVVAPLVVLVANRVIRFGVQIQRYADDILDNGVALTAALDPIPALLDTRSLVEGAASNAVAYVEALNALV